jgi:hypothetical protein
VGTEPWMGPEEMGEGIPGPWLQRQGTLQALGLTPKHEVGRKGRWRQPSTDLSGKSRKTRIPVLLWDSAGRLSHHHGHLPQ